MTDKTYYEIETEKYRAFLGELRDACNRHRVTVRGDSDDSFATLEAMSNGEQIEEITVGSWGQLVYSMKE